MIPPCSAFTLGVHIHREERGNYSPPPPKQKTKPKDGAVGSLAQTSVRYRLKNIFFSGCNAAHLSSKRASKLSACHGCGHRHGSVAHGRTEIVVE